MIKQAASLGVISSSDLSHLHTVTRGAKRLLSWGNADDVVAADDMKFKKAAAWQKKKQFQLLFCRIV
ncbi:conserved hypothetical protein [Ricinus communis]|uniref:Uncharacterized protein n=1 Tax=Ricinus communis TaxID=3988 RepID=B9RI02_RICCO|nr:conserved hypothetical protein [Ricinus communis]